jgi:aminoglycoside 6-adenylyltransferase
MLEKLVCWAESRDDVRAMILVGSRASGRLVDDLSDYDVALFTSDQKKLAFELDWLGEIGEVLLCERNTSSGELGVHPVHYRLVVFDPGERVDFSIHSLEMLDAIVRSEIPCEMSLYSLGYRVLVDKDGRTDRMAPPLERPPTVDPPTEEEFHLLIEDFWHEAHNVARYLSRGDLWSAKFRDWQTKERLLTMLEWNARAKHGWDYDTSTLGKRMNHWLEPGIWESLHEAFGRFEAPDAWRSLIATMGIFSGVARETAEAMEFEYLERVDDEISSLIGRMREEAEGN